MAARSSSVVPLTTSACHPVLNPSALHVRGADRGTEEPMANNDRCPASPGQHRIEHAEAWVFRVDDDGIALDLYLTCGVCGLSAHTTVTTTWADLEWEPDEDDEEDD